MNNNQLKILACDLRTSSTRSPREWNNEMIGLRLMDLDAGAQEYLADYIPKFCKPASKFKFFFDVYDVEEGVI